MAKKVTSLDHMRTEKKHPMCLRAKVKGVRKLCISGTKGCGTLKVKARSRGRPKKNIKGVKEIVSLFKRHVKQQPVHICATCNRCMFKSQVKTFNVSNYKLKQEVYIKGKGLGNIKSTEVSNASICYTCDTHLRASKLPPQASVNNMYVKEVPVVLSKLNNLEKHLISIDLPFYKIVCLPKSFQKGIHGAVVCVPAKYKTTLHSLPRTLDDNTLIKCKLKRKLAYKGHHLYQEVRPTLMKKAIEYLERTNSMYKDFSKKHKTSEQKDIGTRNTHTCPINLEADIDSNCQSVDEEVYDTPDNDVMDTTAPLISCLQPLCPATEVNQRSREGDVFCVAPGEGAVPALTISREVQCFPFLFPNGRNGFKEERERKLTYKRYLNARLFSNDNRFASCAEYIFWGQYTSEMKDIMSSVTIAIRKGKKYREDGKKLTAHTLVNKSKMKQLLDNDEGYKFMKTVRGTPSYWDKTLNDLFSMVRQLGKPTFFVTFSCGERRWPEMLDAICKQRNIPTPHDPSWTEYCEIVASNPVTASRMFNKRAQHLFTDILLSNVSPLGKVRDFFLRTEFQQRGWPHIHALLWVDDAPIFDKDSDDEVIDFVDKHITCRLPDERKENILHGIVNSVQCHSKKHTPSCRKGGQTCRYNFPKVISTKTFISRSIPNTDNNKDCNRILAAEILRQIWKDIESGKFTTAEQLLQHSELHQADMEKYYNTMTKKNSIVLKRDANETWVNPYNETLLEAWNANIDVQYILDAHACVVYLSKYITKAEKELGSLIKCAQGEAREGNIDAIQEMRILGNTYATHREVSVMEAVYRCTGLPLRDSSREVVFVPCSKDSYRLTKPINTLGPDVNNTNVWMTNIYDRYLLRPTTEAINKLSLARFASEYKVQYTKGKGTEAKGKRKNKYEILVLRDGKGYMRKRKKHAVIRYNIKKFQDDLDNEKFFENKMRLHLPHDNENFLPTKYKSYTEFYKIGKISINNKISKVNETIEEDSNLFNAFSDDIEESFLTYNANEEERDAWEEVLKTQGESTERKDQAALEEEEGTTVDIVPELFVQPEHNKLKCTPYKPKVHAQTHCEEMIRSLNEDQRSLFDKIMMWCRYKAQGLDPEPLRIFCTGGAGTGKSHLIKCVDYEATRIFSTLTDSTKHEVILLTALTGTAAFNIGGRTIHGLLNIVKPTMQYQQLDNNHLTTLRATMGFAKILIIDEISMMDKTLLFNVSCRLNQVMNIQNPNATFGNISVITFGDFFQIPPVFGKSILKIDHSALICEPWEEFSVWNLNDIMRQKDDLIFAKLLNRLRTKTKTEKLSSDDRKMLLTRVCQGDLESLKTNLHIFGTNAEVDKHNTVMLKEMQTPVRVIAAIDTCITPTGGVYEVKDKVIFRKKDGPITAQNLYITNKSRVMVIANVDVLDGIVNGVMGTVTGIIGNGDGILFAQPKYIAVKFDNERVGRNRRKTQPDLECITRQCTLLETHASHNIHVGSKTFRRYQFPLKLAWGCTVHKVQGATLTGAVISMERFFGGGMGYVALSRVTSLNGLFIKNFDEDSIFSNPGINILLDDMPQMLCENVRPLESLKEDHYVIVHHNIQSLNSHFKDMESYTHFGSAHVLALTETWTTETDAKPEMEKFPHSYHFHRASTKAGKGGGISIYSKNNLNLVQNIVQNLSQFVIMDDKRNGITIAVMYRHPQDKEAIFRYIFKHFKKWSERFQEKVVVLGDFNDDMSRAQKSFFQKFMDNEDFTQVIDFPTTLNMTLIDHVYVKKSLCHHSGILPTHYSYHDATFVGIGLIESCPHRDKGKKAHFTHDTNKEVKSCASRKRKGIASCYSNTFADAKGIHKKVKFKEEPVTLATGHVSSQQAEESIIFVEEHVQEVYYEPIDELWQQEKCAEFNITLKKEHQTQIDIRNVDIQSIIPSQVQDVIGDGNCLFRVLAYAIAGSQKFHSKIRKMICNSVQYINGLKQMINGDVNRYIKHMRKNGTWGDETCIYAAACILRTKICVFSEEYARWIIYDPRHVLGYNIDTRKTVHINHPVNHFQYVLSIK